MSVTPEVAARFHGICRLVAAQGHGIRLAQLGTAHALARELEAEEPDPARVAELARAWSDHREELLAEWAATPHHPGERPLGWWRYECGEERPEGDEGCPWPWSGEAARLLELGELSREEFRELDTAARAYVRILA